MKRLVYLAAALLIGCAIAGVRAQDQAQEKLTLSKLEQEVLDLTNQERAKQKLPALKPDPLLFEIARAHTANMAKQAKLEHELDGKNPLERIKEAGYKFAWGGENIAYGDMRIAVVMKSWMESKLHRENILDDKYTEIGVGAVKGKDGNIYYTQVFGRPRK